MVFVMLVAIIGSARFLLAADAAGFMPEAPQESIFFVVGNACGPVPGEWGTA